MTSKTYNITPNYKKSTYQIEQWNNILQNGQKIRYEVTTYFRWGTFEIELDDDEKNEILKKDTIILNDYSCSCNELTNGCDRYEEIVNENNYSNEEKKEIQRLLYCNKEDEYNSEDEYCLDEDLLETNGWSMDDTIYGFDTGCELELIDE